MRRVATSAPSADISGQTAVFERLGLSGEEEAILSDEVRLLRFAFAWVSYALRL